MHILCKRTYNKKKSDKICKNSNFDLEKGLTQATLTDFLFATQKRTHGIDSPRIDI